jgi:hypothetical protein
MNAFFFVETSGRTSLHDTVEACTAARLGGSEVFRIPLIGNPCPNNCRITRLISGSTTPANPTIWFLPK